MSIIEYEVRFYKLDRHASMILPNEYKCIGCFIRGMRLPICMETQSLVSMGRSFVDISNYS